MLPRVIHTINVNEGTTAFYEADLINQLEEPVPLSVLQTFTLTIYDKATEEIINSRDEVDILNDNGGTFDEEGHLTMTFEAEDNPILGTVVREEHTALFHATWDGGEAFWDVRIRVRNLTKVPV